MTDQIVVQMLVEGAVRSLPAMGILTPVTQVAHHPAFCLFNQAAANRRRRIVPDPRERIGLGDEPPQFFGRTQSNWKLQHRHPQVESRHQRADHFVGSAAQIEVQDGPQVVRSNPIAAHQLAILLLRQIRIA